MEKVCPLCNALQGVTATCPCCGHELLDGGPIQNYLGPYSPYVDMGIENQCVHLLYCEECRYDFRVAWDLVII